jgi:hypothetical protein
MAISTIIDGGPMAAGAGGILMTAQQDSVMAPKTPVGGAAAEADDRLRVRADTAAQTDIATLKRDLADQRRQVHGLRSKLHGELGLLALRIEENERRAMRRRKVARRWGMAAVVAAWLWLGSSAVAAMLDGPFLLPGLLLVGMTLLGGIALVVLILHNQADEQDHTDRHQNWFRLIARDGG